MAPREAMVVAMVLLLTSSLQARQLPSRSAGLATRVKRENKVRWPQTWFSKLSKLPVFYLIDC